MKIKSKQNRSS